MPEPMSHQWRTSPNLIFLLLAVSLLLFHAGCSAETITETVEVTRLVTEQVEIEGEQIEVTRVVTVTEIVEVEVTRIVQVEVETEPTGEQTGPPPASPTAAPTTSASPTPGITVTPIQTIAQSSAPAITQTPEPPPFHEERIAEVEYPHRMRLGESDVVRLSVIPDDTGYQITAEFPEHTAEPSSVNIPRQAGFDLALAARLDGVSFDFSPEGDQFQDWLPDERMEWRWTISPERTGQQRLSLILTFHWLPQAGNDAPARQSVIYSRGLDVQVTAMLGLTTAQWNMLGGTALVLGLAGIGLFALVRIRQPEKYSAREQAPNHNVTLKPHPEIMVSKEDERLLRTLFDQYERVALEVEFHSGYSGARTYLALPIHGDGRNDAYTIAKLGERNLIEGEYRNYKTYVENTLPPVTARIQSRPITVPGASRLPWQRVNGLQNAALRYTFIGEPGQRPLSLRQKLQESPDPELLEKLFKMEGKQLSLHGRIKGDAPPWRIRLQNSNFHEGAIGRVVHTRATLMREWTADFERYGLPDPLLFLPPILNQQLQGTRSIVHGDLNLENVLVGPGDFVWLIDFARTQESHTLFDFAHLAAEIISHVLTPRLEDPKDFLDLLQAGGGPLLATVRDIACRCLFNPHAREEYDIVLYLSCLGALKYNNLEATARHNLYLAAAHICQRF